ncbi:threonyl-tRNA synthetase [Haplosporangium bisporale]|nr:threonyl-tRNA synthetase [Haplosporangium bisporale]
MELERNAALYFLQHVNGIFGFEFSLDIVTRPKKYLGNIKDWDIADGYVKDALNRVNHSWTIYPGDGALYCPMICVIIHDGLRNHQYATLQIDFQLPEQFNFRYRNNSGGEESNFSRLVMIHRSKWL